MSAIIASIRPRNGTRQDVQAQALLADLGNLHRGGIDGTSARQAKVGMRLLG